MNSSLPRFVLKPWEFEGGALHSPFADFVLPCQWNEERVSMRLKVRENLLFFAPVGDEERLFACAEPLAETVSKAGKWRCRRDRLEKWFRLSLEHEWWTRVVLLPPLAPHSTSLPVLALVKGDGVGWLRRLYENEARAFWLDEDTTCCPRLDWPLDEAGFKEPLERWESAPLAEFLGEMLRAEHEEIVKIFHSPSAQRRGTISKKWVRGSEEELLSLLSDAVSVFEDFSVLRDWEGKPTGAHYRLASQTVQQPMRFFRNLNWDIHPMYGTLSTLFALFSRLHLCVAQSVDHLSLWPNFSELTVAPSTSSHERLEAMMRLREAVRGTSIEGEVVDILRQSQL